MRIAFAGPRGLEVEDLEPWPSLLEPLRQSHDIVPVDQAQGMVLINHQWGPLRDARRAGIARERLAMIMLEPDATLPEHGNRQIMQRYGLLLCGSPRWAAQVGGEAFPWPQTLQDPRGGVDLNLPFRYRATMVAGEKRSGLNTSQYGLRRRTLRACSDLGITMGLAGPGWEVTFASRVTRAATVSARGLAFRPRHLSLSEAFGGTRLTGIDYAGPVGDKFAFMRQAPIAVVIENSRDYISEKLIDAVVAGVAPLFVGPPLSEFGFPDDIAIAVAPSADAIASAISDLSHDRIESCISAGQAWLALPGSAESEAHRVFTNLGARLASFFTESA